MRDEAAYGEHTMTMKPSSRGSAAEKEPRIPWHKGGKIVLGDAADFLAYHSRDEAQYRQKVAEVTARRKGEKAPKPGPVFPKILIPSKLDAAVTCPACHRWAWINRMISKRLSESPCCPRCGEDLPVQFF